MFGKMEPYKTKVYIKIANDFITAIDADWNISDKTDWVFIDEGQGDKYYHAQNNYFAKPIMDMQGCHNFKYIEEQIVDVTEEDRQRELTAHKRATQTPMVRGVASLYEKAKAVLKK